jgi:glucose-1-phosphate cytidylyltransferase
LVDTGDDTLTGGRLKRVAKHVKDEEAFCFTYGDGLADVDIGKLIAFHKSHGKKATVTAVQPPGRYGNINIEQGLVLNFQEKPQGDGGWINGGYFVLEPEVFDLLEGDQTSWESETLPMIAHKQELSAFNHHGFWQAMDTLRDKNYLESLWENASAPWKVW